MTPDIDALYELMEIARLTPEALAAQTELSIATVRRTLEGKTSPRQATRGLIADALGVPPWRLTQVVWPQTHISEEERQVHRRRLLQIAAGGSAAAAASLLPGIDPLEVSARVSRLVARFVSTKPETMLAEAVGLLGTVLETLDARVSSGERDQMLSDAVDLASVAAWSAAFSHRRAEAAAYFALAREYAELSEDPFLKAATLASSARLDRPIAGNRPDLARRKLSAALPLLGDSVHGWWATWLEAEAYAALDRPRECFEALERAHGMVPFDSGKGFFSSAGQHADWNQAGYHDEWTGLCYAHLGQADKAIRHLGQALTDRHDYLKPGHVSAASSEAARAYTVAGEPEAACAHAVSALTDAQETGYRIGVVRVRQVRARMWPEWAPLSCVQELDERLLLVP